MPVLLHAGQSRHRVSRCGLAPPSGFITDPQLTALAVDFNPLRVLAPNPGRLRLIAQRHTPDRPVHTKTLIFAVGLKALSIAINHTIVLTASAWQKRTYSFFVPRLVCTVITVKAAMMVTVFFLIASLPDLFGTGSAAIAAIHKQTDTWRAHGRSFGAFAGPLAVLAAIIGLRGDGFFSGQQVRRILSRCTMDLWCTSRK